MNIDPKLVEAFLNFATAAMKLQGNQGPANIAAPGYWPPVGPVFNGTVPPVGWPFPVAPNPFGSPFPQPGTDPFGNMYPFPPMGFPPYC